MKNNIYTAKQLLEFSPHTKGVFSTYDLHQLFGVSSKIQLHRILNQLEHSQFLYNFCRGIYITPSFDPYSLVMKIDPSSYISCASILSENLIIGSTPGSRVYAITSARSKKFSGHSFEIHYYKIQEDYFNHIIIDKGIRKASPEKAFIDNAYLYLKGIKPYFDIYSDLNLSLLNFDTIDSLLSIYKNKKFISFVKGLLNDYNI